MTRHAPQVATVRLFSLRGPCIILGQLVSRTAAAITVRTADGTLERYGGTRLKNGWIHTEPCNWCPDGKGHEGNVIESDQQ